ncbi:glycosyltransferase family protein [Thermotalea metallivorans]|uniref:Spore protein YkvP n=1 Tax=Thermotalea metallivorans TaxID=520762 RepID=A0A140L2B7_9FIRM|nr:glycosyltransferase [Thermotalea metallivorans]KXG74692.1 Spore protein YkvP [Thermotalea metallivorans]
MSDFSKGLAKFFHWKKNEGVQHEQPEGTNTSKRQKPWKVAYILDHFSYECLKYECNLMEIDDKEYMHILDLEKPDLLLVESAWAGNDGKWKDKIANLEVSKDKTLGLLVEECRARNIPTVFWNKEDPLFFSNFIEAAKLFDYVFTTDEGCIEKYREILKHDKIYNLSFAAQPRIHNPTYKYKIRLGRIAFAGTWYHIFPHRARDMEMLLDPALHYGLHIYDRMYHSKDNDLFQFPEKYHPYICGSLDYKEMIHYYKHYDIFLNANLIHDSSTMFSRRVFELLGCGTNVISSYATGIADVFPGIVKLCRTENDTSKFIDLLLKNKELRDRLSLLGQRSVFRHHTYQQRVEKILEKVGLSQGFKESPGVSIVAYGDQRDKIEKIFQNFQRQAYAKKELIMMVDSEESLKEWEDMTKSQKNIKIFFQKDKKSLGECLNFAVEQICYDYFSVFDADDDYGPEFIGDIMDAFLYAESDIIGKGTHYVYLKKENILAVRYPDLEYDYVDFLDRFAFVMKKNLWEQIKFPNTDTDIVKKFTMAYAQRGQKIFSTDRFNYVHMPAFHQDKPLETEEYLQRCQIVLYTRNCMPNITV